MIFLIFTLSFISVLLTCFVAILLYKYLILKQANDTIHSNLDKVAKVSDAVRYGDLSVRIENLETGKYKRLIDSTNRMIETLEDREKMIVEYQKGLKEKNEHLEKMIVKEKENIKAKQDFVATLTHDLKVPIIAESNMFNFILEGKFGELTEKQREVIINLSESNKNLIELVETILETYRLEDKPLVLNKENVNIRWLLEDTINEMMPIAQSNNQSIKLSVNYDGDVELDAFQMKRVLKNLISNGLSFSSVESQITIECSSFHQNLIIKIVDTGVGIKKEELDKIFDKFYSTSRKFRKIGTGLGLYLSQQIIKAHKGQISVQSEENEYTIFTIELPL